MSIKEYKDKSSFIKKREKSLIDADKSYKVLLIGHSYTDSLLITKYLKSFGDFKILEAENLKEGYKVIISSQIDFIMVDNEASSLNLHEVLKRLTNIEILRNIPKIVLLNPNYEEKYFDNVDLENIDFIKKPVDKMILKSRLTSIINGSKNYLGGSIFEKIIDQKIDESKEFLKFYKSFLDIDSDILFIYDKNSNQVVESNRSFNRFFVDAKIFNRVIKNPKILSKFVPPSSDPTYLNNHHFYTWLSLITEVNDFNFLVTLKKNLKDYTFSVKVNRVDIFKKEFYIIKLSNHNINFLKSKRKRYNQIKIDSILHHLKSSVEGIDSLKEREEIENFIVDLLDEFDISSESFKRLTNKIDEINAYFVVAKVLKDKDQIVATLNQNRVDKDFKLDSELIYVNISADLLNQVVDGILKSYHDLEDLIVNVRIFKVKDSLKVEMITKSNYKVKSKESQISKIFQKDQKFDQNSAIENAPKYLQQALKGLRATLQSYTNSEQNIFLINIPLK